MKAIAIIAALILALLGIYSLISERVHRNRRRRRIEEMMRSRNNYNKNLKV